MTSVTPSKVGIMILLSVDQLFSMSNLISFILDLGFYALGWNFILSVMRLYHFVNYFKIIASQPVSVNFWWAYFMIYLASIVLITTIGSL